MREVAKIDIFADKKANKLKDMTTVIEELAAKWEGFNDVERAGIAEAVAGKQQAAVFQSLMQNFDVMKEIQGELANGEHWQSMEKENSAYVDSLAGQLNKLKETWVGIFNTIFSSDATKSIIKGLVAISEAIALVVTKLDEVGMLTPMLTVLGTVLAGKVFKGFLGFGNALRGTTNAAQGAVNIIPALAEGLGRFGLIGTRAGVNLLEFGEATGLASLSLSGLMPWVVGATVAVGGLAIAYDYFNESLNEEKQRLEESISTRKSEIDSIEQQKKSLGEIADEYDKLKNKPAKTNDEVERLKELTNEVAKIMPELIIG
ncbi:MAG: phage tail tape measure protein [Clostridium sp.]|uniref:phage tail tape measure protein n=1 Tax=Clostridium sp. TaxID=1506 RepID=UPI003EE5D671